MGLRMVCFETNQSALTPLDQLHLLKLEQMPPENRRNKKCYIIECFHILIFKLKIDSFF
jgi:hypothetical protein